MKKIIYDISLLFLLMFLGSLSFLGGYMFRDVYIEENLPLLIADRFAEVHNYTLDVYDCENYTKDLSIIYHLLDYESYAFHNYNTTHAYSLVALEPQNARLFKVKSS